jgi:hypothetical protein
MKYLILTVVLAGLFVGFTYAIEKNEKIECIQWQKQSKEYSNFTFTDWQAGQCEHHGVALEKFNQ